METLLSVLLAPKLFLQSVYSFYFCFSFSLPVSRQCAPYTTGNVPLYYGQCAPILRAMRPYTTGNVPLYYGQRAPMLWATCPFFSDADMVRLTFLTFLSLNTVRITLLTGLQQFHNYLWNLFQRQNRTTHKDMARLRISCWPLWNNIFMP